ncbi:hypothetical protein SRRS_19160 [Sporomusa rhizae]|uniref:ShlB/FhaC/HecB family hemolysin secretion/activation protein n=1 Tax=Sporomusa rhizae TaxID=357999 RepID=UPI00352A48B2
MQYFTKLIVLVVIFFISSHNALAKPSDEDIKNQEKFIQQQEQRITAKEADEDSQRRSKDQLVRLKKDSQTLSKIELPQETPSFYITEIQLQGLYKEKLIWAEKYLKQYENQKIGLQGINLLVKNINEALVNKGYITSRVYVKEQDLSTGVLVLHLAAGTIGEIRFADEKTWGTWKNAFPVHSGDLLNIRDIEQGLEQMKRVPSQEVDIKIQPAKEEGQSDLLLAVKRSKSWKVVTTIDDSGTKSTGKLQSTAALGIDNLFSINDIFNISFNKDAEREGEKRGTRANSFYYSIPLGRDTLSFSKSSYSYHQTVNTAVLPSIYSGKTENYQFTLTHLLHRDQTQKTNFEFGIINKKRHSFIDDTEITVQHQDTTAMRLGLLHKQYFGNTVLDVALRYQKGVPWLGAEPGITDNLPGQPTTKYEMYLLDLNLDIPLKIGKLQSAYSLNIRGQQTNDFIYGSEFFSIGGQYTVRGFDGEQTLSAENGFIIRNEIKLPVNRHSQIYAALDYGRVQGASTEYLLGTELLGSAVGVRGKMKDIQYDVFVGWPLKKPDGFKTANQAYGFQITMQI